MSRTLSALAAALAVSACASINQAPKNLENACAIIAQEPSYMRAMARTQTKWSVPVAVQMAVIYQESKFVGNAKTPRKRLLGFIPAGRVSSARGYSQALDGTWAEYREDTGNRYASRGSFGAASDFIGWYMAGSNERLGISTSDTKNQYLAYHEGRSGYARGTHKSKSWLLNVANEVETRAIVYDKQLRSCT